MTNQRNLITIILGIGLLFTSCIRDIDDTNVPEVRVNLELDLTLPECTPLRSIGNAIALENVNSYFINKGYNGVMVIQASPGVYYAYDQCCTNNPTERHKLNPNGVLAECQVCKSVFILDILGTYSSGPAPSKYNLRKYNAQKIGTKLLISN